MAAPLFFSLAVDDASAVVRSALAVVAFCLTSSAVYVLNDWRDRAVDARHPVKRFRPLASGELGGHDAAVLGALLTLGAVASMLPLAGRPAAWAPLLAYIALNVAYSLWFRSINLIDVIVIASGFVLRVLAGTGAVGVEPSSWIILCTGLLALFLALGKRRGDIGFESAVERASLASYNVTFIDLGLATLAGAVITFYAQFTVSDYSQGRFETEHLYLTTFPVAVGVLRYLQVLVMGPFGSSPSEILLRDRALQSLIVIWGGLFAVLVVVAKDVL